MKNNSIKKSLSIVLILSLMCLVFISCKDSSKDKSMSNKDTHNTVENQKESTEKNKNEECYVEVETVDVYGQIIGVVNDLYLSNGKKYIDVDQVEFFIGEEAYIEAAKDGELYKDENGNDFLPNGYYIRNNYSNIETYEVNEEAIFNLCTYIVDSNSIANSSEAMQVSYEEFEAYINNSKILDNRSRIFWVDTKNKVVENITMQFTP